MSSHRHPVLALVGAAALIALTACGAATGTADEPVPPTAAAPSQTDCGPDQVTATTEDRPPAAGYRSLTVVLRNNGSTDCRLTNPPAVELLDGAGAPLPTKLVAEGRQEGQAGPVDVLAAGAGVEVVVAWRTVPSSPDADPEVDCGAGEGLRVRLTGTAQPIDVPAGPGPCDAGTLYVNDYATDAG